MHAHAETDKQNDTHTNASKNYIMLACR